MIIGEGALLVLLILVSSFMLYRLIREERRTLDELSEFWGRITHEIKTPITGLRAFLETLKRQDLDGDKLQPLIELALKQVDRQQQLAHNLLIGQRLRRGAPQLDLQSLNLRSFIDQFFRQQTSLLAGVDLEVSVPSENDLWITADPDALRAILDNLMDNAIKYSSPSPKLSISVSFDDHRAWVLVRDFGIGFPPHQAEHLFDAYRRLKEELPGHSHGTGMGLYISRQLARRMNGDLIASSDGPGQGAEFLLSLPLALSVGVPEKNS
jgi:signal transduction histidine kinase